jgi:hypothetical protein
MGFFNKRQSKNLPPLVELPKAGEPIVFDDEEQHTISEQVERRLEYFKHDSGNKIFPKEVIETLSQGFAADALEGIVIKRINNKDLKGAASSCMKLLGMRLEILPSDWLLLAKILVLYGDSRRAKNYVDAANKTHKKSKHDEMSIKGWEIQVQEVNNIIEAKNKHQ